MQRGEQHEPLISPTKVDSADEMLPEFYEGKQQQQQQPQPQEKPPKEALAKSRRKDVDTSTNPTTAPLVASRAKDDKLSASVDDLFSEIYEEEN